LSSATEENWERAELNPGMSPAEARFWYEAMSQAGPSSPPRALVVRLRQPLDGPPLGRPEILSRLRRNHQHIPPQMIIPLARLLSAEDVVEISLSGDLDLPGVRKDLPNPLRGVLRRGIQRYLIPYLSHEQQLPLQDLLRERLRQAAAVPVYAHSAPVSDPMLLAASFGLHKEMDTIVSGWPDSKFQRQTPAHPPRYPQWLIFGLSSADSVRHHLQRLKLRLVDTEHVHAWLAHTELADLAFIRDSVLACTQKAGAERLLDGFALVKAPEAAPLLLELKLAGKAPQMAGQWLEEDPARTAAGLVGLASHRGKLGEAAQQILRDLSRAGHAEVVETVLEQSSAPGRVRKVIAEQVEPASTPFDKHNTPEWLLQAAVEQLGPRPSRLPSWLTPEHLPPLRLGEHHLDPMQVHATINALRESTFERQTPLAKLLKERIDPASRDNFAWALCERWLAAGAPSKDRWALIAVGLWGGDASVVKLSPMVRNWPAQKQAKRALLGLECLRAIGTDTALLELSGIAQKIRFRKLQQTACGFMIQIASERRLSTAQLEDRIVPTLDLDARGTRIFDFGTRRFRLVLGHHLRPMLCDEAGRIRADLPKPGAADDPVKAAEAVAAWKVFKKQIREVLKVQQARLESAMLSLRCWSVKELSTWLVQHPLIGLLAQGILWGGLDSRNRLVKTFRVTEDRTFAQADETPCVLDELAGVFIVHPLHLSDEQRRAWLEVFTDHEVLPPFPQLTRRIYRLQPDEAKQTVLRRYDGKRIQAGPLIGILNSMGWDRGQPDMPKSQSYHRPMPSRVTKHLRYFHQAALTAVVGYRDGLPVLQKYDPAWPNQVLDGCYFVRRLEEPADGFQPSQAVPLGSVDPVVMSEVLHTLEVLASKAV
jgi:hypothetical protein